MRPDGERGPVGPTATAVIVPVPAMEDAVARHRRELDVAAGWGVPAHVTVLSPFVPPDEVDAVVLHSLRRAVASVPAFDCTFATTAWFDQEVVWVRPDPSEPFRALTRAVFTAFPQCPPYGGVHGDDVVPHLTVGEARRADLARLRQAEASVRTALPVSTRITHAWLVKGAEAPSSWRVVEELPLAPRR